MIPFFFILKNGRVAQLLYLFQLLRLPRLFQLLNPKGFKTVVTTYYEKKISRVLENKDYELKPMTDHNHIMKQMFLGYTFRVLRLVLILFTMGYFIGTLWYLFCW